MDNLSDSQKLLADKLAYQDWLITGKMEGPSQAKALELQASPFAECRVLAMRGDSLGALIKSSQLDSFDRQDIIDLCQDNAVALDAKISCTLVGLPRWKIRRKVRNVKRRLLVALLVKHAGYSTEALKGAKFNLLVTLAKNKGLVDLIK